MNSGTLRMSIELESKDHLFSNTSILKSSAPLLENATHPSRRTTPRTLLAAYPVLAPPPFWTLRPSMSCQTSPWELLWPELCPICEKEKEISCISLGSFKCQEACDDNWSGLTDLAFWTSFIACHPVSPGSGLQEDECLLISRSTVVLRLSKLTLQRACCHWGVFASSQQALQQRAPLLAHWRWTASSSGLHSLSSVWYSLPAR